MFGKIVGSIWKNVVKIVNHRVFHGSSAEEYMFPGEAILEDLLYLHKKIYVSHERNVEKIEGTFQTGGKSMSRRGLTNIEKSLISTAAAVAAGCKPCTVKTVNFAREAGAAEADITRAITIGMEVKRKAWDEMQQEARKHVDISIQGTFSDEIPATTKTDWLIATGAALAANSTLGLEHYSATAEQLGATAPNVTMALEIARRVKAQAEVEVEKIVGMITPLKRRNSPVSGACGCIADRAETSANCCS
jgi:hypothetical protein